MEGDDPPTGGVSRSGRIRKKSSKLRDYQSADDWDGTGAATGPPATTSSPHKRQSNIRPDILPSPSTSESIHDLLLDPTDTPLDTGTAPNRSIYMSEKSSKNRVLSRDGVTLKRQTRKDKGRTRMTAYMLWARSVRSQMDDDLDFAAKSQRLGELWANVPISERQLWKRRVTTYNRNMAKQAAKDAAAAAKESATGGGGEKSLGNSKFLNKSRGSTSTTAIGNVSRRGGSETTGRRNGRNTSTKTVITPPVLESTDPINIAAHLKLLGDSLSNIGESLEQHEHKGHNSITGTVSVLLDSLLCSVVPLISLTTQIEGFGHRVAHLKPTLQDTLDNIAYVMPGLPF